VTVSKILIRTVNVRVFGSTDAPILSIGRFGVEQGADLRPLVENDPVDGRFDLRVDQVILPRLKLNFGQS
jgi:hypothetical protein